MSAAPAAEPTAAPAAEPNIDDLFAAAADELTTRTTEPAADKPTPEEAPVSDDAGSDEPADTTPESRERDANGRFAPKEGEPKAEAAPPEEKQAEPEPDLRQQLAILQRQLESTRGNVDNAARQAAEQARQEAERAAERRIRDDTKRELERQIQTGELTHEQATAIWSRKNGEWAEADRQVQEQEHNQKRAGLLMSEVETDGQQKMLTLYHHGAQVMAQDTGLSVEEVRGLWADQEERQRFLRASFQAQMAEKIPGAGFNKAALEDYMATMVGVGKTVAALKQGHKSELAARDKEIARLTKLLNREEADTDALREPEPPARGSGPRRKAPETLEEAGAELAQRLKGIKIEDL
jgi:hypothetical protein